MKYKYKGNLLTDYECSQIQRGFERTIREKKRILASYDAAMKESDNEAQIKCIQDDFSSVSVELKQKEKELKNFCRTTNRSYDSTRTQVVAYKDSSGKIVNFGRSTVQKAVWANKKSN